MAKFGTSLRRNLQDKLCREIRKRRTLAETKTKDRSGKDGRYCSKAIEELGCEDIFTIFSFDMQQKLSVVKGDKRKGFFSVFLSKTKQGKQ